MQNSSFLNLGQTHSPSTTIPQQNLSIVPSFSSAQLMPPLTGKRSSSFGSEGSLPYSPSPQLYSPPPLLSPSLYLPPPSPSQITTFFPRVPLGNLTATTQRTTRPPLPVSVPSKSSIYPSTTTSTKVYAPQTPVNPSPIKLSRKINLYVRLIYFPDCSGKMINSMNRLLTSK